MSQPSAEPFQIENYIISHYSNSSIWHPSFLPEIHLPTPLTVHALMLILSTVLVLILCTVFYRRNQKVPSGFTNALEATVLFIRDEIAITNLGEEDGRKLTPLLCTFFVFILFMNLIGIIPFFASPTANINVTLALALVTFCLMTFGAIARNGVKGFFNSFIIHDLALPLRCVVFTLDILGLFIKTAALTVRLFANMLAGHMVIMIFLGLVGLYGIIAAPAIILAILITLLEVFVAFLQAYIFTMLSAVFIGQVYHPSH
jgi:F-type H+-transporting ATPase subunit a